MTDIKIYRSADTVLIRGDREIELTQAEADAFLTDAMRFRIEPPVAQESSVVPVEQPAPKTRPPHPNAWTWGDDNVLVALRNQNRPIAEIAKELGRTKAAVNQRLYSKHKDLPRRAAGWPHKREFYQATHCR